MKLCNTCQTVKEDTEFNKKKFASGNYGLQSKCKACQSEKYKKRYASESEEERARRIAKAKEWRGGNRDKVKSLKRKYRVIKKTDRLSNRLHEQHVIAHHRYWVDYQAQLDKKASEPHDRHVKDWKSDSARLARWKAKHDLNYAINQRMRVAIRKALKSNKSGRRWESILGYTLSDLKTHLLRTMPEGRTMEDAFNGRMHIDHIVPKSLFNLSDEKELKRAWCLTNLRLVDAEINLRKGSKCIYLI